VSGSHEDGTKNRETLRNPYEPLLAIAQDLAGLYPLVALQIGAIGSTARLRWVDQPAALNVRPTEGASSSDRMSGRYHPLMQRQRVILDLDQAVAALLAASAADAHVSEGEIVERALRAMDLRALVARIRARSELDEDEAMGLVQEELRAARADRAA